ncbi:MAG: helix-turn-helix transcriptional regulator [Gammaproteobacteria bacterium]
MLQEHLLRLPAVAARVGFGRSTLYAMIKRGEFPKPIALGSRAVAWVSSEVDAWIARRILGARAASEAQPVASSEGGRLSP